MTLLFADGFDAQDTSLKWSVIGAQVTFDYTFATRYGSGLCVRDPAGSASSWYQKAVTPSAKLIAGCAFYFVNSANLAIFDLLADSGATPHIRVSVTNTGAITIGRAATVVATSAAGLIGAAAWNYIEVSGTVADSGGTVDVHLNGVSVLTYTGDTRNGGTSTNLDMVQLYVPNSNAGAVDDLYVCNGLGSVNNDFLGEIQVQNLKPNGAGSVTNLTPVGSGTNYQNVDEVPASATDYNYSSTVGHQDLYALEDVLGGTTAVLGVQVVSQARKTSTSARSIKNLVRVGGTTTASAAQALGVTAAPVLTMFDQNPTTAAAWAVSDIANLEAGVEVG